MIVAIFFPLSAVLCAGNTWGSFFLFAAIHFFVLLSMRSKPGCILLVPLAESTPTTTDCYNLHDFFFFISGQLPAELSTEIRIGDSQRIRNLPKANARECGSSANITIGASV